MMLALGRRLRNWLAMSSSKAELPVGSAVTASNHDLCLAVSYSIQHRGGAPTRFGSRPCGCRMIAGSLGCAGFQTRKEVAAAVDEFEMVSQNSPRPNLLQYANEIPLG